MKTPYKCPYQHKKSCDKVDPNGWLYMVCEECEHYENGVRETGSFLSFSWFKKKRN